MNGVYAAVNQQDDCISLMLLIATSVLTSTYLLLIEYFQDKPGIASFQNFEHLQNLQPLIPTYSHSLSVELWGSVFYRVSRK